MHNTLLIEKTVYKKLICYRVTRKMCNCIKLMDNGSFFHSQNHIILEHKFYLGGWPLSSLGVLGLPFSSRNHGYRSGLNPCMQTTVNISEKSWKVAIYDWPGQAPKNRGNKKAGESCTIICHIIIHAHFLPQAIQQCKCSWHTLSNVGFFFLMTRCSIIMRIT